MVKVKCETVFKLDVGYSKIQPRGVVLKNITII